MTIHSFHSLIVGEQENGPIRPLNATFEEAYERLGALPRMFLEPDGSFVWVSPYGQSVRWQVDGNLQDAGPRLHSVMLLGQCDAESFAQLLSCFRKAPATLHFELVHTGESLTEAEFFARFITGATDPA